MWCGVSIVKSCKKEMVTVASILKLFTFIILACLPIGVYSYVLLFRMHAGYVLFLTVVIWAG